MRLFIVLLLSVLSASTFAQKNSCCEPSSRAFAALSSDKDFVDIHENPVSINLQDELGSLIKIEVQNGPDAQAYFIESKTPSNTYLLVYHEWWGLNDYIKLFSDRLYNDLGNVNVLALDLYDGKQANTREAATELMNGLDHERGKAIIEAALSKADDMSKGLAEFQQIGWCLGGGWSLESALLAGSSAKACVMYYGMPVNDSKALEKLSAPVLFVFAEQDQWINHDVVNQFNDLMSALNKSLVVESYDAVHAFANPSNPKYDKEAAEDAYRKTLRFLIENQ